MAKISTLIILLLTFLGVVFAMVKTSPAHRLDDLTIDKMIIPSPSALPQIIESQAVDTLPTAAPVEEVYARGAVSGSFQEFILTPVVVVTSDYPFSDHGAIVNPALPPFLITPGQ